MVQLSKFIKRFIVSTALVLMVSLSLNLDTVEASTLRATANLNVRSGAGTNYRKVTSIRKGNTIIATDSNGNPQTYTVTKLLYNQTKMTDEICGWLEKEYIVLQTSEHRINGNRQGNRIVIADRK